MEKNGRDLFCARDPAKLVNKIMMDFQEKGSVLEATNSLNYFLYLCIPLSRYSCMSLPNTYDNDRTYKNDTNTLSWHTVNASFWVSTSYGQFKSLILESWRPRVSSNTPL